jgi:hypothetical protein
VDETENGKTAPLWDSEHLETDIIRVKQPKVLGSKETERYVKIA